LTIPFLTWCKVPLRRAIGTAAANGLPIALAGAAGYIVQGSRVPDLPSPSLGYIYLPALALVVVTSMLAAPLGARVAHRLPVKRLRVIFALLLRPNPLTSSITKRLDHVCSASRTAGARRSRAAA